MLGTELGPMDAAEEPVPFGLERGGIANDAGVVPCEAYCARKARRSGVPIGVELLELSGTRARPRMLTGLVGVDMVAEKRDE